VVDISWRSVLLDALHQFRRVWPQLLITDLLARILAVTILTPLVGLLLRLFLATTQTGVVADQAIAGFLLHPAGMAALVVVGAVSLSILFIETGQFMVIGFAAAEDRRATWLDAFVYVVRRVPRLARLAAGALIRLLVVVLPFLAAAGIVYWLLLTTYDINYYLARKPIEFKVAVFVAGILAILMTLVILFKIAGWILSLPMVLFEAVDGGQALRASRNATSSRRRKLTLWLIVWIAASVLLSMGVTHLLGRTADLLIPRDGSSVNTLLGVLVGFLVISLFANFVVSFLSVALFPLLVVRIYRSLVGPGELRPGIAERGTLGARASFRIPRKTPLWGGAAVLGVVLVASYRAVDDPRLDDRVQVIAHRGGAAVAPENTMAAFRRGIADGADWLELDVQENADGEVVIEHDRDFMRVADVDLQVWQATDEELAHVDVGSFFSPEFSDQRVPKLRDVLELARNEGTGLFIELKYYGHDVALESKVVDLVEQSEMASRIVIMSLEYDGLEKTKAMRPGWTYGLLNAVAIGDLTRLDVDFLALTSNAASLPMIRRTHERGKEIYAWTIDDPVGMWIMMSRGVDGIITDRVDLAHQVIALREQVTPLGRFIVWMAGESGLLRTMERSSAREDA